jgi:hypothetical protein
MAGAMLGSAGIFHFTTRGAALQLLSGCRMQKCSGLK